MSSDDHFEEFERQCVFPMKRVQFEAFAIVQVDRLVQRSVDHVEEVDVANNERDLSDRSCKIDSILIRDEDEVY